VHGTRLVCAAALALGLASAPRAHAVESDLDDHVSVSPSAHLPFPTNGRITLTVVSNLPDVTLENLSAAVVERRPELRSDRERVPLRILEKHPIEWGGMVVLAPKRRLRPKTAYTLVFDPPLLDTPPTTWTTATSEDRAPARWLSRPTAEPPISSDLRYYDELRVLINVSVSEPAMFVAVLRAHQDGDVRRFHLLPRPDGRIEVSALGEGGRFTLKLTAIDVAGHRSNAPGPPIEIVVPVRRAHR
jgi:hypothetical protein